MIELKKVTKINGQIVVPYYIKDGEVMCFDKNGNQVFIDEKEFYKKPIQEREIQSVIPLKKEEKKVVKTEEPVKKEEKKIVKTEEPVKKEEKVEEVKDNIIKEENYI